MLTNLLIGVCLLSLNQDIHGSFHQVGGTISDGVNCYIRKCAIYYPWLWLLINIAVISFWRWRDWCHSNLKNNCECALIIKDNRWYIYILTIDTVTNRAPTWWNDPHSKTTQCKFEPITSCHSQENSEKCIQIFLAQINTILCFTQSKFFFTLKRRNNIGISSIRLLQMLYLPFNAKIFA